MVIMQKDLFLMLFWHEPNILIVISRTLNIDPKLWSNSTQFESVGCKTNKNGKYYSKLVNFRLKLIQHLFFTQLSLPNLLIIIRRFKQFFLPMRNRSLSYSFDVVVLTIAIPKLVNWGTLFIDIFIIFFNNNRVPSTCMMS